MRTKQIAIDAAPAHKVGFRDKYIELALLAWVGVMVFVRCMGWGDDAPTPLLVKVVREIIDIVLVAVFWRRIEKMLPRRGWQAVTFYALALAALSLLASAGYYFWENEKFSTSMFIVTAIFLLPAACGAYAWRRRVVKCREIILYRELITSRKRKM